MASARSDGVNSPVSGTDSQVPAFAASSANLRRSSLSRNAISARFRSVMS